jgi:uncharacterized membrane protein
MPDEPVQPPPTEPPSTPSPDSNRTIMFVLAYLGALSLVPLLVEKNDKEIQWHAKNGLLMFGAWVVAFMIDVFVVSVIPFLGCLYSLLMPMVGLLYLVLIVLGIVKALNGQRLVIPYLSGLADKF